MDLFNQTIDRHTNRLPYEGTVNYYGKLMPQDQANDYLQRLLDTIEWKNDEAVIFGKKIVVGMGAGTISAWMRQLPELI